MILRSDKREFHVHFIMGSPNVLVESHGFININLDHAICVMHEGTCAFRGSVINCARLGVAAETRRSKHDVASVATARKESLTRAMVQMVPDKVERTQLWKHYFSKFPGDATGNRS